MPGPGRLIAGATCLLLAVAGPGQGEERGAPGRPSRIVSLNMCTDELLLRLADRDRIASVTWLSQNPASANMAAVARTVPTNHGLAEEVLAARPDLVLAGLYTTRTTVALLKRAGLRVVEFGVPTDLAGVFRQVRDVAAVLGEPERGEALVAGMERRLVAIDTPAAVRRPTVFMLRPNGVSASRHSLVDDLLSRAGLDNLAARQDLGAYGQIPLEKVVLDHADLLVIDDGRDGPPSLATIVVDHPILQKLRRRIATISVPGRLWTCGGPSVIDAIDRLRQQVGALGLAARR